MASDVDDPYNQPPRPSRLLSRSADAAGRQARGVWRAPHNPPGMVTFNVVTSDFELLMRTDVAEAHATPDFIENLWKYLDRKDPQVSIELMA